MRKDVRSQTEKAGVAYLTASQPGTVLEPCQILAGGLVDTATVITPPSVVLTASSAEQMGFDSGIYELKLTVCISTQVDDEMDVAGQDIHRERVEAVRDLMEDVQAITSVVNAPATGDDTRVVQNFNLSGIVYESDETKETGRRLETEVTYYICACPSD